MILSLLALALNLIFFTAHGQVQPFVITNQGHSQNQTSNNAMSILSGLPQMGISEARYELNFHELVKDCSLEPVEGNTLPPAQMGCVSLIQEYNMHMMQLFANHNSSWF